MFAPPTTTGTRRRLARPGLAPGREAGPRRPADTEGRRAQGAACPEHTHTPAVRTTDTGRVGAAFLGTGVLFSPDGRLPAALLPVSCPAPPSQACLGTGAAVRGGPAPEPAPAVASGAPWPSEQRGKPTTGQLRFRKRNETPRTMLHLWCSLQFHLKKKNYLLWVGVGGGGEGPGKVNRHVTITS